MKRKSLNPKGRRRFSKKKTPPTLSGGVLSGLKQRLSGGRAADDDAGQNAVITDDFAGDAQSPDLISGRADGTFKNDIIAGDIDRQVLAVEIVKVAEFRFDRGLLHRDAVIGGERESGGGLKSAQEHWLCFQHERQMNELL